MPSDISCETTGHQDCVTKTQDNASQQSVAIAPNIRVRLGGVGAMVLELGRLSVKPEP